MNRRWAVRAGTVTILGAGAGALLWTIGVLPADPVLAAWTTVLLLGAAAGTWWSATDLPRPLEPASWYVVRREDAPAPPALDYRLVRLRRDLRDAVQSAERPDALYPLLRNLTAHRLQERHDVDLEAEPQRARQHLAPPLQDYLAAPPPPHRRQSAPRLQAVVTAIEEL